jgi:cobalt transporter subunit CbtB
MTMTPSQPTRHLALSLPRAAVPAVLAMILGVFVVAAVGFAGPEVLHNAAHDSRHAFAFPCH